MKDNDIRYIKEVIKKTNISKLCKEEETNLSNVCYGRTTDDKIKNIKNKLQKNIEELEKLKGIVKEDK